MLVKVQPVQIPAVWEIVKFVCNNTDSLLDDEREVFFHTLLTDLLAGKKFCLVGKRDGVITIMLICSIKVTEYTGKTYFSIDNVYAFEKHSNEVWKTIVSDFTEFAKKYNCAYIAGYTLNPRIEELFNMFDFKIFTKTFYKEL